jgi:hypothetical protein
MHVLTKKTVQATGASFFDGDMDVPTIQLPSNLKIS